MLTIISTPINKLREDKRNARLHDRKNLDAIKGSLAKFGQQKPIVVDKKGNIIAGNGTYAAAKELGWDIIDVVQTDLEGDNIKAYALADNRSAELAIWNDGILGELLQELRENDFPIADIGFDPGDFFDDKGTEGLTDPDEVPEVPQNVRGVQRGQIWQLGDHRMMCGDSTSKDDVERLMAGEKADMVFTDPPYGVAVVKNEMVGADFGVAKKGRYKPIEGDQSIDVSRKAFELMDSDVVILWGGNYYDFLTPSSGWIVWDKREDTGIQNTFADCELAWTNTTRPARIYRQLWNGMIRKGEHEKRVHPTQKPIALAEWCFENYGDPKSVLDLFLGSGSTLIACEKTNRKCYGMEIDPHYCSVIIERFEKFSGKKAVLLNAKS